MNIVLTGPMGVGKTCAGFLAAGSMHRDFVDTDLTIERRAGRSIKRIFETKGEAHFRELEKELIKEISQKDGLVIATGGGAVLDPQNMRRLRLNGVIIDLQATPKVLLKRLKETKNRPLLGTGKVQDKLMKYLEERAFYYLITDHSIDTDHMSKDEVAGRIIKIASMPIIRICCCVSGNEPLTDIKVAGVGGASMVELRFDLMGSPDVHDLVQASYVPVIATDRKDKDNLVKAIKAGCEFVDIEFDAPEKDEIISLAHKAGCKVIVSMHDFMKFPKELPSKGKADLLKIAVMINSTKDMDRLVRPYSDRKDVIFVGMGKLGTKFRVVSPTLGSYLTYCYLGKSTAPGQMSLVKMIKTYKEFGLR
jgi:shikimate kinase